MSARLKISLLVTAVLIATVAAILWKTSSLLYEERVEFISDSALKQIAPLKRLVSERLAIGKKDLVRFAATRAVHGAGRSRAFGDFEVIALVEPDRNGQWSPVWIERSATTSTDRWPQNYDLTLLKSVAYKRAKDGEILWTRLSDARGTALFAAAVPVQLKAAAISSDPAEASALPDSPSEVSSIETASRRGVVVGFTSENPLLSSTEDFIGTTNSVYVVDDRGYVAAHVDKSYTGALFSEDALVKEILSSQRLSGTGRFEDFDGRAVVGHFEKVPDTNLYAVITTPMTAITGVLSTYKQSAVIAGVAVGIFALILAWFVGGTLEGAGQSPIRFTSIDEDIDGDIDDPIDVAPEPPAPQSPPSRHASVLAPLNDERLREERKNAFDAFQTDFAARLREPLLAVLGQAQLIKAKAGDDEIGTHALSIEREARLAKETIERLQLLHSPPPPDRSGEVADLEEVISGALANKALELQNLGVRVESETDALFVRGKGSELEAAMVYIVDNAIEAMYSRPAQKTLTVTLKKVSGHAVLRIADTGVGMTNEILEHAFEPFFKGFLSPRHMGLGLAFVQSTIQRYGGQCRIESAPGEGTAIEMSFPLIAEKQARVPEEIVHVAAADIEILPPPIPKRESEEFKVQIRKPRPKGS